MKRTYPNATATLPALSSGPAGSRALAALKAALEVVLHVPSPFLEAICRRLYAAHLRRRAASWQSPDQVRLRSDYLKLHTQSHRERVMQRFADAFALAVERAERETAPRAAVGGRR